MTTPTPSNPMLAATFALPGENRAEAAPAAQVALTGRILARTQATQRKLLPQIALVARAMQATGHAVASGVPADQLQTTLSLKAERAYEGLVASLGSDEKLVAHLTETLGRYREAAATVSAVEAAIAAQAPLDALTQELKQAAFYLSRFHEVVKEDPLLAQLFPPPQVLQADAGHADEGQLNDASALKDRARRMLSDVKGHVAAARAALGAGQDSGASARTVAWTGEHSEQLKALGALLARAVSAYDELATAVSRPDAADEPWGQLMGRLGQALDDMQHNPVLRELLRTV